MEKSRYYVNGLINNNSKNQVERALEEIKGIQYTYVDLMRGTVEVLHNDEVSEGEIRNCIENSGYVIE